MFRINSRVLQCAVVMFVLAVCAFSAQAQTRYTSDPNLADFTSEISSYATLSNFSGTTPGFDGSPGPSSSFTPTPGELATYGYRVFNGTLTGTGLSTANGNNWIEATFTAPVSTIVVFPNIDHFGGGGAGYNGFDGYQYQIAGSNDGSTWTVLFNISSATPCSGAACIPGGNGEPFTLGTFTGTAPTSVNNVLSNYPTIGLQSGCAADAGGATPNVTPSYNPALCTIGYIATFTFPTAYKYYAFGTSTLGAGNTEQEFSAVGAITPRTGTATPTSGALLTIIGNLADGNNTPVNIYRYDSQIHSMSVQAVPVGTGTSNCDSSDASFPTDAYVLQGGSWTGCDPGDGFEVTDSNTSGGAHQVFGTVDVTTNNQDGPGFNIKTHYTSTGSVTITNNTGSQFNGTIKLLGNPTIPGTAACPIASAVGSVPPTNGGTTLASSGAGLAASAYVTLSIPGDSSACGGFNAPQIQQVTDGVQATFNIGKDVFNFTGLTVASGDFLSVLPMPVPAGPLGSATFGPFNQPQPTPNPSIPIFGINQFGIETPRVLPTAAFSAANFSNQACVPIASFSASDRDGGSQPIAGATRNPVCPELQLDFYTSGGVHETNTNTDSFLWSATLGFTVDPIVGLNIGGVHALTQHDSGCPPTPDFNVDTLVSYFGDPPAIDYPSKLSNSCIVNTYEPATTPIATGATIYNSFNGFQKPVDNCPLPDPNNPLAPPPDCMPQPAKAGSTIPLIWVSTTTGGAGATSTSGAPITNLQLCTDTNIPTPPSCNSLGGSTGVGTPSEPNTYWVWVGFIRINNSICNTATSGTPLDITAGTSGLQNLGALGTAPAGTYQFNWKTPTSLKNFCATPVFVFSTGLESSDVAEFRFN